MVIREILQILNLLLGIGEVDEQGQLPLAGGGNLGPGTSESSQTESDDVSPQIQRKRRLHSRDGLPRFSISMEDEHCGSV